MKEESLIDEREVETCEGCVFRETPIKCKLPTEQARETPAPSAREHYKRYFRRDCERAKENGFSIKK